MGMKKYKQIRVERESHNMFSIYIDEQLVDTGVKFKEVSKKINGYLRDGSLEKGSGE